MKIFNKIILKCQKLKILEHFQNFPVKSFQINLCFFSDQDGMAIDLPKGEQKALILAMSYHEKGFYFVNLKTEVFKSNH
jgi:hypothetical protein